MTTVSVIIPFYNSESTIAATINSVLIQTVPAYEIICVDDCSQDESNKIVHALSMKNKKVKLISTRKNYGGPAAPRNIGVDISTGTHIAFLDADDLWQKNLLEIYLRYVSEGYSMVSSTKFSFLKQIDFEKHCDINADISNNSEYPKRIVDFKDLLLVNDIVNSSVLVEAEILKKIKFNVNTKFIAVEDFLVWCQVHQEFGKSLLLDLKLVGYRVQKNSLSANKFRMLIKRHNALKELNISLVSRYILISQFLARKAKKVLHVKKNIFY